MKRPAIQMYPGDWKRDTPLQSCSLSARGLWIEMLFLMHDGEPYGYLRVGKKDIHQGLLAQMVGAPENDVKRLLAELEEAGVFSRDEHGTIFCRRMVKDENLRQVRASAGVLSLNNPRVPKRKQKEGYPSRVSMQDVSKDIQQGTAIGSRCSMQYAVGTTPDPLTKNVNSDNICQPPENSDALVHQIIALHPYPEYSPLIENAVIQAAIREEGSGGLNYLVDRMALLSKAWKGRENFVPRCARFFDGQIYNWAPARFQAQGNDAPEEPRRYSPSAEELEAQTYSPEERKILAERRAAKHAERDRRRRERGLA